MNAKPETDLNSSVFLFLFFLPVLGWWSNREITCHQTFHLTFDLKPVIRRCLCSQRDTAEHAQRHIDENKRQCLAKCLLEWSNISNISHNNEKQNLFLT